MGRLKVSLAVFASTWTIFRLSGKTQQTHPVCQLSGERGRRAPSANCCTLYLPPTSTNIAIVLCRNTWWWSCGTSLKQKMVWVKSSSSLGSKVTGVRGQGLRIASTSIINVTGPSSVRVCSDSSADRIFRTDRMSRSQTLPIWLVVGGLNCQAMPRCRNWLWIDWELKRCSSSLRTFCSYEMGTIIAIYDFWFTPSTNEALKGIDEGIGR